jgi:hypothetical protein
LRLRELFLLFHLLLILGRFFGQLRFKNAPSTAKASPVHLHSLRGCGRSTLTARRRHAAKGNDADWRPEEDRRRRRSVWASLSADELLLLLAAELKKQMPKNILSQRTKRTNLLGTLLELFF